MRRLSLPLCLFSAALLSGCGMLYTNIHMPRAYRTAAPSEVKSSGSDKTVEGKACARSVLFMVAWGDASYAAAARDALKGEPPNAILYDVKSDMAGKAYLVGLYAQTCTKLTGRVALQ
ncbi:MAG TPA: hypothetical protein DCM05_03125 [Elusimicrobia bacterium]|nr:hypothetical protein [Elusimicrobiota bacterium]